MLRKVSMGALIFVLFMLPIFLEMHYVTLYYIFLASLSIVSLVREFLGHNLKANKIKRWKQKRKEGFVLNFIIHTIYFILYVNSIVIIGQLFGNGNTPVMIIQQIELNTLIILLFLTSIIAMIGSVVHWYENEKMIQ